MGPVMLVWVRSLGVRFHQKSTGPLKALVLEFLDTSCGGGMGAVGKDKKMAGEVENHSTVGCTL